jgi:hypothetical protein
MAYAMVVKCIFAIYLEVSLTTRVAPTIQSTFKFHFPGRTPLHGIYLAAIQACSSYQLSSAESFCCILNEG